MWVAAIFISRLAPGGVLKVVFLSVGFYFLLQSEITGKNCAMVSVAAAPGGRALCEITLLVSPWGKDANGAELSR